MNIDPSVTEVEIDTTGGNFLEIVMIQLGKVVSHANVEFRGGYYSTVESQNGEDKIVYVPDTREIYANSILALCYLLKPRFDKNMRDKFKIFKEQMKKIEKEFIDASEVEEEIILGEAFYENTNDKILFETYRQKKLRLYIGLFASLTAFLARKNYFEMVGGVF